MQVLNRFKIIIIIIFLAPSYNAYPITSIVYGVLGDGGLGDWKRDWCLYTIRTCSDRSMEVKLLAKPTNRPNGLTRKFHLKPILVKACEGDLALYDNMSVRSSVQNLFWSGFAYLSKYVKYSSDVISLVGYRDLFKKY